jgi:hypothetical protein
MLNYQTITRPFSAVSNKITAIARDTRADIDQGRLLRPAVFMMLALASLCLAAKSTIDFATEESQNSKTMHLIAALTSCGITGFCAYTLVGGYCSHHEPARFLLAESGGDLPIMIVAVTQASDFSNDTPWRLG